MKTNKSHIRTISSCIAFAVAGVLLLSAVSGCSTRKNGATNRFYNTMVAKYNWVFNARTELEEVIETLTPYREDDFYGVIPLEPLPDSSAISTRVKPVLAKLQKTIKKRSMEFDSKEQNKAIGEAYLLLGISYYLLEKYPEALEIFNFTKVFLWEQNAATHAKIWAAKANIRVGNAYAALDETSSLVRSKSIPGNLKEELQRTYIEALLSQEDFERGIRELRILTNEYRRSPYIYRYRFALGQALNRNKNYSESIRVFSGIISDKNAPRPMVIESYIENTLNDGDQSQAGRRENFITVLKNMLDDPQNEPWFGRIHFRLAEIEFFSANYEIAASYYLQALQELGKAHRLAPEGFYKLAKASVESSKLAQAKKSYEKYLGYIDLYHPRYFEAKREVQGLTRLIEYTKDNRKTELLLSLAGKSDTEKERLIEKWYAQNSLDNTSQIESIREAIHTENTLASSPEQQDGLWYFSNQTQMGKGREEFFSKWGKIAPSDNWREHPLALTIAPKVAQMQQEAAQAGIAQDGVRRDSLLHAAIPRQVKDSILQDIPKDTFESALLESRRNFNNYTIASLWRDVFGKGQKSASMLENLLEEPRLEPAMKTSVLYRLYTTYSDLSMNRAAEKYKTILMNEFPESYYSKAADNSTKTDVQNKTSVGLYEEVYHIFRKGQYEKTRQAALSFIKGSPQDLLSPKFALLSAICANHLYGVTQMLKELEEIRLAYPSRPEADDAKELIDKIITIK